MALIFPRPAWVDRFVMRLAKLQPSLPWELANAVAKVEFEEDGWKLEPETAAELYANRHLPISGAPTK